MKETQRLVDSRGKFTLYEMRVDNSKINRDSKGFTYYKLTSSNYNKKKKKHYVQDIKHFKNRPLLNPCEGYVGYADRKNYEGYAESMKGVYIKNG